MKRDPLLSQVCHDLRAPLAAVTMGAGFVLQTTTSDPRSQRVIHAMLRACRQMDRLIKSFSDLSEIQAGSLALDLVDHDARALVETVIDEAESDRPVDLTSSVPADALSIRCDVERLKRALAHLVANAIAHAPDETTVSVAVQARGDRVVFSVTDHGGGIDPEIEPHLFDSDWLRARSTRSGPGFGLAIAGGFARAHGGDLRFERRGVPPAEQTIFELSVGAQT